MSGMFYDSIWTEQQITWAQGKRTINHGRGEREEEELDATFVRSLNQRDGIK